VNRNLLKARIVSAGYTQARLAQEIGISKNTMSAKVNGKSSFDTVEIEKICYALGISSTSEKADIFLSKSSQNRDNVQGQRDCPA